MEPTPEEVSANPLMNLKEPSFITPDPKRPEDMFMIGRYHGKGSVMSFKKIDGEIKWHA